MPKSTSNRECLSSEIVSLGTTRSLDSKLKHRNSILVAHNISNRVVTTFSKINSATLSRVVEVITGSS